MLDVEEVSVVTLIKKPEIGNPKYCEIKEISSLIGRDVPTTGS